jgi:hypothetical protein
MEGNSILGCGLMTLSHHRLQDGSFEATLWVTVLYLPVLPLSRWKVKYFGEAFTWCPHNDPAFCFGKLQPLPLDPFKLLQTYSFGFLTAIVAVAPSAAFVLSNRGAMNMLEIALMLLSAAWPVALIVGRFERQRRVLSAQRRGDAP